MTTSTILSLIASLVAIIVAVISGLFSYFSSKRSTKVQAMQAYLGFLQRKMDKLEEALIKSESTIFKFVGPPSKLTKDNGNYYNLDWLIEPLENSIHIISNYAYLFTDNRKSRNNKLLDNSNELKRKFLSIMDKNDGEIEVSNQDAFKQLVLLYKDVMRLYNEIRELLIEEMEATYNIFKELSLSKENPL